MIHTWQQLTYIHGLGAELPSHVFNPDKQVYHSQKNIYLFIYSLFIWFVSYLQILKRKRG